MATPAYVLKSLKYWYDTGVKIKDDINALVAAGKITRVEADEILNAA